jgi:hypothetical protein
MTERLEELRGLPGRGNAFRMGIKLLHRRLDHQPNAKRSLIFELLTVRTDRWRGDVGVTRRRTLDGVEDRGGVAH